MRTDGIVASGRRAVVRVELASDQIEDLKAVLAHALAEDGCALVVRNTVRRAQETAAALRVLFGDDVHLMHSRFILHDRSRNDEWLRQSVGPPLPEESAAHRPKRCIVVATQVVEQSLDIDFDILVTDIAPIDLVLQRLGRVHRHARGAGESGRPRALRDPRCIVTGVRDWGTEPPQFDAGVSAVYTKDMLYRAAALLMEITEGSGVIRLPQDIAPLVHRAYGDEVLGPESWQPAMARARSEAASRRADAQARAGVFRVASPGPAGEPITGWLHGSPGEADETATGRAQVRDSDDSIEVLLLQRSPDGQLRVPDWIGDPLHGAPVPVHTAPDTDLVLAMARCSIRLPGSVGRGTAGDELLAALESFCPIAWQTRPELRGQLVLALDDVPTMPVAGHWFRYSESTGLEDDRSAR